MILVPRGVTALLALFSLGVTEGCRSFQPTHGSEVAPESWISARSDHPFPLTLVPLDGSAIRASCPVTSLEGRLRAKSGDTLYLRAITNPQFSAGAEPHCSASTAGYLVLGADSSLIVSSPRYDAQRTRFMVVVVVVLVGVIAMSFATADWGYDLGLGFLRPAPEAR